jgi:molybdopterin converting factor small subunit
MKVTVKYHAQARAAAGVGSELVEGAATVQAVLEKIGQKHGDPLKSMILTTQGLPHPSILLFVGDEQVRGDSERSLRDGDILLMLSPISGG